MLQNKDILELQKELDTAFGSRFKLLMRVNYSDIYKARRTSDGLTVAIRIVIKRDKSKVDLDRVLAGARNHEKIQQYKNPNVLTFYEWMQTDSSVFIVTEYCQFNLKTNYEDQIINNPMANSEQTLRFSEETATFLLRQLANGLFELHRNNIIHRNLTFDSLMLAVSEDSLQSYQNKNKQVTFETLLKDNVLKLMDFSVSREIEALEASTQVVAIEGTAKIEAKKVKTRTRFMSFVGDAVTMAPEVANSHAYGLKADIYSLGVLIYFIVCGKYPFYEGYQKHPMNGNKLVEFPREVKLSQPFKQLIVGMCRYDQDDRLGFEELLQSPILNMTQHPYSKVMEKHYRNNKIRLATESSSNVEAIAVNLQAILPAQTPKYQKIRIVEEIQDNNEPTLQQQFQQQQPQTNNIQLKQDYNVALQKLVDVAFRKKYVLVEYVGAGMSAQVFRAIRIYDHRVVAIKVINKEEIIYEEMITLTQESIKLHRELSTKQNIPTLHDSFEDNKCFLIVTDFCSTNLEQFFKKYFHQGMDQNLALHLLRQLINALSSLHFLKVIHRDLKLDNIMIAGMEDQCALLKAGTITPQDFLYHNPLMLIDFGISAKVDNGARTSFAGSPETMAPEVFEGRPYGLQADIFSLGVIAYRLVTGSPPFLSGNDYREHPSKGQAPQKRGLSEQYYKLVKSMCEYDANLRIKFDALWDSPFLNMNVLTQAQQNKRLYKIRIVEDSEQINAQKIRIEQLEAQEKLDQDVRKRQQLVNQDIQIIKDMLTLSHNLARLHFDEKIFYEIMRRCSNLIAITKKSYYQVNINHITQKLINEQIAVYQQMIEGAIKKQPSYISLNPFISTKEKTKSTLMVVFTKLADLQKAFPTEKMPTISQKDLWISIIQTTRLMSTFEMLKIVLPSDEQYHFYTPLDQEITVYQCLNWKTSETKKHRLHFAFRLQQLEEQMK